VIVNSLILNHSLNPRI